jgi:hypothetical protein
LTIQEVYDAALPLACEVEGESGNEDYEARAPYLVAALCYRYSHLDVRYREAFGLDPQRLVAINYLPLTATFPLCDDFSPAISAALAGLLVLSENPEMSARLTALADDLITELRARIPYQKERIVQMYNL